MYGLLPLTYRKIPKAFLVRLFSGDLISGGTLIIGTNFAFQNGLDLTIKTT